MAEASLAWANSFQPFFFLDCEWMFQGIFEESFLDNLGYLELEKLQDPYV